MWSRRVRVRSSAKPSLGAPGIGERLRSPLVDGTSCAEPVGEAGQPCVVHRRAVTAARAADARAARRRPASAQPEPPPLADEDAATIFAVGPP